MAVDRSESSSKAMKKQLIWMIPESPLNGHVKYTQLMLFKPWE
jgi:hypothetical protein